MALDLVTIEEPAYQEILRERAKRVEFPLDKEAQILLEAIEK